MGVSFPFMLRSNETDIPVDGDLSPDSKLSWGKSNVSIKCDWGQS